MVQQILRLPRVKEITGLSRSSIYQMVAEGNFPKPITLGTRAVGWIEGELTAWIGHRAEMRGAAK